MSSQSCSVAPMPFVTGGGPVYYQPPVQTVQPAMADPFVQPLQLVQTVQSPIPAQPDISGGGGVMSPMQVPVSYPQQQYVPQQMIVPQQAYVPQQMVVPQQVYVPQQQYVPQQVFAPQQQFVQQPMYAQQPFAPQQYVAPQQQYVPPQTMTPQVAPAPAQAAMGQAVLGGGGAPFATADMSNTVAGLEQAVASLMQLVQDLSARVVGQQMQPQSQPAMGGGGPGAAVTGGGAAQGSCCGGSGAVCCGGGASGGGPQGPASTGVSGGGAVVTPRTRDNVETPPIPTALTPKPSATSKPTSAPAPAPRTTSKELPPIPPASGPAPAQNALIGSAPLKVKGKEISKEQRDNLNAVLEVGKEMGADRKTMIAAVATVIQESVAQNLDYGDRDSLGLFQQRPSQGWGTREQVRDPKYAARKFFDQAIPANKENPNLAVTQLAQKVQRSGLPDAYAQWEGEANAIVTAFGG